LSWMRGVLPIDWELSVKEAMRSPCSSCVRY